MTQASYPAQSRDYDHLFKLLIIGDSGSGKSALLYRFADNIFTTNHVTTVGVDFRIRTVKLNGERIKLQIWDTAGQERFRTITSTYYRGTHGVIVVYDVTNGDSFASINRWMEEVDSNCELAVKMLVGNKDDDQDNKVVLTMDAQRLADQKDVPFFEVSAKDNAGVEQMFTAIAQEMLQVRKKLINEQKRHDIIHLKSDGDGHRHESSGLGEHGPSSRAKSSPSCC